MTDESTSWDPDAGLAEWERYFLAEIKNRIKEDFDGDALSAEEKEGVRLAYMGTENAEIGGETFPVTRWRVRYPAGTIEVTPADESGPESVSIQAGSSEILRKKLMARPGLPTAWMLIHGALWCWGFQAGKASMDASKRDSLRGELVDHLSATVGSMPEFQGRPEGREDLELNIRGHIRDRLESVRDGLEPGTYAADLPPFSVEVDTEGPQETPEFAPDPFQGDDEVTFVAADPFSSAAGRALVETPDGAVSGDNEGEWGSDSTGHPIRVEQLRGQYSGRVTFRVQAYGETDPTAVDAEMGWAMLQEMDMGAVWLHALLLAHASAPGRRGERKQIRIPRKRLERLLGFRSRNATKWERAEQIKEYMDQLRSVFVQFQNVERHGDRLRFRHEMNATPLWSARMVAEGEKDLFSGQEWSDWHLEAREGMWAEEFLHEHGDQWAPLPKEWFEKIDRRGSDWGQRLAVLCLFLFRANREQGGRVNLSASRMLRACGVDLEAERDKDERYDLKQRLSSALDDLHYRYGMDVQDGDVNTSKIEGRSYWTTWKNQTVTIDPPEKIDRNLLSEGKPERAPLPDSKPGRWGKREINALLNELGWTQKRLADRLPVSTQSVSHYVNDRRAPTDEVRRALDRIEARHC